MKRIKMKKPTFKPQTGTAIVELVKIEYDGYSAPNMDLKTKPAEFGEILYTSKEEEHLIGKLILVDPYRKEPIHHQKELVILDITRPIFVEDGKNE